jgi:hypothetical protein
MMAVKAWLSVIWINRVFDVDRRRAVLSQASIALSYSTGGAVMVVRHGE